MAMVIRPLDPRILTVLITLPLQNNNTRKKNLIKKKTTPILRCGGGQSENQQKDETRNTYNHP
jgi:hypothetical protein